MRLLPSLLNWAHGRLPRQARQRFDTEDLVQEAALAALTRFSSREEPLGNVEGYLRRSIRNRIVDEVRHARRLGVHAAHADHEPPDPSPLPVEAIVESEERRRFRAALAQLNEDDQHLIVGRIELGLSWRHLARATGRSSADAARVAAKSAVLRLARATATRTIA